MDLNIFINDILPSKPSLYITKNESIVCKKWHEYWRNNTTKLLLTKKWHKTKNSEGVPSDLIKKFLLQFPLLTDLYIDHVEYVIPDFDFLGDLTNLQKLNFYDDEFLGNDKIYGKLTNITDLTISNGWITDDTVKNLLRLKSLKIKSADLRRVVEDETITDASIQFLTGLETLEIYRNYSISDISLQLLTNLTNLKLDNCGNTITDVSIGKLTKLVSLSISCTDTITDTSLLYLTNLTSLSSSFNEYITGKSLLNLPNLTVLDLSDDYYSNIIDDNIIDDNSVSRLTNLTSINLSDNHIITDKSVSCLTNLTSIKLSDNHVITDKSLSMLTKLVKIIH